MSSLAHKVPLHTKLHTAFQQYSKRSSCAIQVEDPSRGMAGSAADPAALLRIYMRQGRVEDAAMLALTHLHAWQTQVTITCCWGLKKHQAYGSKPVHEGVSRLKSYMFISSRSATVFSAICQARRGSLTHFAFLVPVVPEFRTASTTHARSRSAQHNEWGNPEPICFSVA